MTLDAGDLNFACHRSVGVRFCLMSVTNYPVPGAFKALLQTRPSASNRSRAD